jgi:hypothetical protein
MVSLTTLPLYSKQKYPPVSNKQEAGWGGHFGRISIALLGIEPQIIQPVI